VLYPALSSAGIPLLTLLPSQTSFYNRTAYPMSVLYAPSDTFQARSIVSIVLHYGWQRIAVLGSDEVSGAGAVRV
jgi:hypothetical protein